MILICHQPELKHISAACNHPILVTGDWKLDEDAVINRPESNSQEEDEDAVANELINALGNLDLSSKSKCQICFKTCVTLCVPPPYI